MKAFLDYLTEADAYTDAAYAGKDTPPLLCALTDDTYKNVWQRRRRARRPLSEAEENTQLATLGDAVLKLALAQMLYAELLAGRIENVTVEKQRYESDRVLVTVVGRHYGILSHLRCNTEVARQDYDYTGDEHKHIATAAEAVLGAIYLTDGWDAARAVVGEWRALIDASAQTGREKNRR